MANINQTKLAAEKVLKEIKEKKGKIIYPINPIELLKEQNAIITYSYFDKLEGLLLYDKEKSVVAINMNRPIKRQRFTAAHELGHILLHTEVKANSFLCPIAGKKNDIEKEADSFASYLLMPTDELEKMVDLYQDEEGKVGLDECLLISEYFGVSFESCVKTICFRIRRFQEELDNNELTKLIKKYKPNSKRKEMLNKTNDLSLLVNAINYSYFSIINLNDIIGIKFIQKLVYHDSRLERLEITQEEVNGIFADLRIKGNTSKYCKSENQNIIEVLGNLEMNKYCLETDEELDIFKIKKLNKLLYKYTPYPEYTGHYRTDNNLILGGAIQPVSYLEIFDKMEELDTIIKSTIKNINKYTIAEYITIIAKIHYELTVLHPFNDGNGRTIRALTNWLLRLKGLCPIYIDSNNRDDYLEALRKIDEENDYELLEIVIIKSIIRTMAELHKSWQ